MEKEVKYGVQSPGFDAVPMHEIEVGNNNDTSSRYKSTETFCSEFRNSKTIQSQVKRSVCNSGADIIMGWTKGQIGPAFPDIMMISGADLENGSAFMTSFYTGNLLDSVLGGVIYSRLNKYLFCGVILILHSLMVAAIPWCYLYDLMVAAHIFFGVCEGLLAVAIGCETVDIWGPTPQGHSYLMGNNGVCAIASVLAPLVTAPFLLDQLNINKNETFRNATFNYSPNFTSVNSTNQTGMYSMESINDKSTTINRSKSKLYIAYTISAVLGILVAMLFFVLFCQQGPSKNKKSQKDPSQFIGEHSPLIKRLQLFNTSVFSVLQNAIDYTFTGYLAVFCVEYLGWTNTLSAMVTSVAFFTRLLGTVGGVFLVRYVQSHHILLITTSISAAGFIGLTISSHYYFDAGIWISVCVVGIPYGVMWPNMLSWLNENLIPLRGAVSGFLHFTVFLGALLAPQLFGYMMKEISLLWFCYLCCIKSTVMVVNAILMFLYTHNKS